MVRSIDSVLNRGERLSTLVDRTDELSQQSRAFRKRATVLKCVFSSVLPSPPPQSSVGLQSADLRPTRHRRKMWYRNVKVLAAISFSGLMLLYFLLASVCGAGLHCGASP